jgi:hypothetical protein
MKTTYVFYRDWLPLIETLAPDDQAYFYSLLGRWDPETDIPEEHDQVMQAVVNYIFSKVKATDVKYKELVAIRKESGRKGGQANQANQANATIT